MIRVDLNRLIDQLLEIFRVETGSNKVVISYQAVYARLLEIRGEEDLTKVEAGLRFLEAEVLPLHGVPSAIGTRLVAAVRVAQLLKEEGTQSINFQLRVSGFPLLLLWVSFLLILAWLLHTRGTT